MAQPHPPVTPARWPVAPSPSFRDWRPRPSAPKPEVEAKASKAKA